MTNTEILGLARSLIAISEKGLIYSDTPFHVERYNAVKDIGAKLMNMLSQIQIEELNQIFIKENGYPTPKLDVRAVVSKGDSLLFVKEKDNGLWALPGGWLEIGETPKECIEKEVKEESGYLVTARKVIGIFDREKDTAAIPGLFQVLTLYLYCEIEGYDPTGMNDHETCEASFFVKENLPPLSLDRISKSNILRAFEHLADSKMMTDFE